MIGGDNMEALALQRLFERVLREPASPGAYEEAGSALLQEGEAGAAEKYLRRALELDPDSRAARRGYAEALYRGGKWRESAGAWRAVLERERGDRAALSKLADCCYLLGRYGEAAEYAARAAEPGKEGTGDER